MTQRFYVLPRAVQLTIGVIVALAMSLALGSALFLPFGAPSADTRAATNGDAVAPLPGPAVPEHPATSDAAGGRREHPCTAGVPDRLVIPSLDVDAPFELIGLDQTSEPDDQGRQPLGNPADRTKAGWYRHGPRPGSGSGTILTTGHTYRDGSALFQEDFAERIDEGQRIDVRLDNGTTCRYRVDRVWREVDAAEDYPRIVVDEHLYDFEGPERLFLATCGGRWNESEQEYDDISILVATRV